MRQLRIEALDTRRWIVRDGLDCNLVQNGKSGCKCTCSTANQLPYQCKHVALVEAALADPDDRRTPPAALAPVPIRRLSAVGEDALAGPLHDETLPEAA